MSFIRARQGSLTRRFPHQGNKRYVIPGRAPISVVVTAGTGTTCNGDGTFTMAGRDASLSITGRAGPGVFRFRWDIIAPEGTVDGCCSDPVSVDHIYTSDGLATLKDRGWRGRIEGSTAILLYHPNLSIEMRGSRWANDTDTVGNIRLERYSHVR